MFLINSYRFATQQLWTPAEITTALWLDADDASTVTTVSGAVSQWNDKSGNGRNASQSVHSSRPLFTTNSQNGKNGITFDGLNDYLVFSSALLANTHSLFILFKPTIESAIGTVFGQWSAGEFGRYLWNVNQTDTGATIPGRLNVFNNTSTQGSGHDGLTGSVAIENEATMIASISALGTEQWKILKNGTERESATIARVFTGVNSSLGSLNAGTSSSPYDGVIYEVILLLSYASIDIYRRIEGYLAHKWGIAGSLPSDHPYKSAAPTA